MKLLLVPMLLTPLIAFAVDCSDLDSQSAMNECTFAEFKKVDNELNDIYNTYRARLREKQKQQLKDAQLAWIKFRDLTCEFESSGVEGGSVYPMVFNYCLARITASRVKDLTEWANCKEGNLSCPAWK